MSALAVHPTVRTPIDLRRFYLIGFLALMAFDTLAQVSFKQAGAQALPLEFSMAWLQRVFGQAWIYGAFVGYVGAFVTWMTLLEHAPIGPAFAASHLEIVAVLAVSSLWFGEHVSPLQWAGALLIFGGIGCLAVSEGRGEGEDTPRPAPPPHPAGTPPA